METTGDDELPIPLHTNPFRFNVCKAPDGGLECWMGRDQEEFADSKCSFIDELKDVTDPRERLRMLLSHAYYDAIA